MRTRAALFLDRDGTLIEDPGYLRRIKDIRLIPGAASAVKRANDLGILVIVVSNQSGVARGFLTVEMVRKIQKEIERRFLREGGKLDAFYFCPHHPEVKGSVYSRECNCRKPNSGMLQRAAAEWNIDLDLSIMIGDSIRDVVAGQKVGSLGVLVLTGQGRQQLETLEQGAAESRPDHIAEEISSAVDWALDRIAKKL